MVWMQPQARWLAGYHRDQGVLFEAAQQEVVERCGRVEGEQAGFAGPMAAGVAIFGRQDGDAGAFQRMQQPLLAQGVGGRDEHRAVRIAGGDDDGAVGATARQFRVQRPIGLADATPVAARLLAGEVRGRVVVDVNA